MPDSAEPTYLGATISRRTVLGTTVLVGGVALTGCTVSSHRHVQEESVLGAPDRQPTPPADLHLDEGYTFFTEEESRTVEAIVARIIPGDETDPGAIQAGVPLYIDRKLEMFESFAEPTYHEAPFAQTGAEGEGSAEGDAETVAVPADQLYRYGFQSPLIPQQLYRTGLAGVERLAQTRHGSLFADLDPGLQDQLLMLLEAAQGGGRGGEQTGDQAQGDGGSNDEGGQSSDGPAPADLDQAVELFGDADPSAFFQTVRTDTIEGMFSDPVYGGNRDLIGWKLVGWPGAQRSYSPEEMMHGTDKQPASMAALPSMNPDRIGGGREALEQPRPGVHSH